MKKLFILISALISLTASSQVSQVRAFMPVVNGTTTTGGGATPVVEQTTQVSFIDQFVSETASPGWEGVKDIGGTTVASGNYTKSGLHDVTGASTSIAFNLFEAGAGGVTGTPLPTPASNVIFGDPYVVGRGWNLGSTQEASFRLTGLVAGRTYRVWILSNDDLYRHNVIAFKCNGSDMVQYGTTSTLIDVSNNYGTASDQLTSSVAKLFYIEIAANGSGQLTFDPDWVSSSAGNARLVINAMVVQRMNFGYGLIGVITLLLIWFGTIRIKIKTVLFFITVTAKTTGCFAQAMDTISALHFRPDPIYKDGHRLHQPGWTYLTYPPVYSCVFCNHEISPETFLPEQYMKMETPMFFGNTQIGFTNGYGRFVDSLKRIGIEEEDWFFIEWNKKDTNCISNELASNKSMEIWNQWKSNHANGKYYINKTEWMTTDMVMGGDDTRGGGPIYVMGGRFNDSIILSDKWYKIKLDKIKTNRKKQQ